MLEVAGEFFKENKKDQLNPEVIYAQIRDFFLVLQRNTLC